MWPVRPVWQDKNLRDRTAGKWEGQFDLMQSCSYNQRNKVITRTTLLLFEI